MEKLILMYIVSLKNYIYECNLPFLNMFVDNRKSLQIDSNMPARVFGHVTIMIFFFCCELIRKSKKGNDRDNQLQEKIYRKHLQKVEFTAQTIIILLKSPFNFKYTDYSN